MKFRIGDRALFRDRPVVIPDNVENKAPYGPEPCPLCGDPECVEWPTLWAADGSGALYHVSECKLGNSG